MNCGFDDILFGARRRRAFTFMEVVTALVIVSVITFSVLVVINRGVAAMIEGQARAQAFDVARENMEKLISSDSVTDMAEFGTHELNEDIQWETVVEAFDEPVNSDMWIRAVCSASYPDRNGERQTIELVHWLTNVSITQQRQIRDQQKRESEFLENMEGNPFGDDADGLTQYARALVNMGEYEGATNALFDIIFEYPESPQASMAINKIVEYGWTALRDGDAETTERIFNRLKAEFPDDEDVHGLPDVSGLEPGQLPVASMIPPRFRATVPRPDSPTDDRSGDRKPTSDPDGPKPGPDESGPDGPGPDDPSREYDPDWTDEQRKMFDAIMDMLEKRSGG